MKFISKPAARRPLPLRVTLIELQTAGVIQVFRRPSIFRLWEPLREHRSRDEDLVD